jgi:hypothetical protein
VDKILYGPVCPARRGLAGGFLSPAPGPQARAGAPPRSMRGRCLRAACRPLLAGLVAAGSLLAPAWVAGQTGELRGTVRAEDGGPIPAAAVTLLRGERVVARTETDSAGRYRLAALAADGYTVVAASIGFLQAEYDIVLAAGGMVQDFTLAAVPLRLEGVDVRADRARRRFEEQAGSTVRDLDAEALRLIPGLAEADVMRAVQALPGVVSVSDFSASFNVRGGGADQNLILLDGFPVYNPFHLAGVFGVFNADMVQRVELLAGGFPARYGGRVSSVLSVESDAGAGALDVAGGISLLAARLAVGAAVPDAVASPLGVTRARVRVAGRRSYIDRLFRGAVELPYHMSDLQLYGEAWTPAGTRLLVSAYTGEDVLDLAGVEQDRFPLRLRWDWGNDVVGAAATVPLGAGDALDVRGGWTRFGTALGFPDFSDARFTSGIRELHARADLALTRSGLTTRLGAEARGLDYGNIAESGGTVFRRVSGRATQLSGHGELAVRTGAWLLEGGLRADMWIPDEGPRQLHPAPRLAAKRFLPASDAAVRLSFGRYTQFAQSVRDEEIPFGVDLWVLSNGAIPAVVSNQAQLGYERFLGDTWRLEAESYIRSFRGVIANNFTDDPNDPADDFVAGRGLSVGGDLLLERRPWRGVGGWLALSLLKATRTFPDATAGPGPGVEVTYPPIFDRRLDLELVLRLPLPRGADAGLRWNYGSGLPYTRPLGSFAYHDYQLATGRYIRNTPQDGDGLRAVTLSERNAARYPAYHRLDAGVRRTFRPGRWEVEPYLEVLNVYNRRNVLFYFYQYDRDPAVRTGVSMFPILPTLGLEARF